MILVDSSIWIDHLRRGVHALAPLLDTRRVLVHPAVFGELLCGSHLRSAEFRAMLSLLPQAVVASHDEVVELVTRHRLDGRGIGWVDVNLLASARLSSALLWTADRRLREAADDLDVAYRPAS